ncbi:MAG: carbon storage regulator [Porticoccaceae bacterium]
MLILTRREGETIVVDHDIRITVTRIKGGQVKLGIDAPEDVDIVREELIIDEEWRKK